MPYETTILKFRRLLETHHLPQSLFDETAVRLAQQGLLLHQGTIVDATHIAIAAPPSTKNRQRKRNRSGPCRSNADLPAEHAVLNRMLTLTVNSN